MVDQILGLRAPLTGNLISLDLEELNRFFIEKKGEKYLVKIIEKTRTFNINGKKENINALFEEIKNGQNKYLEEQRSLNLKREALEILAEELAKENVKLLKDVSLNALNKEVDNFKTKITEQRQSAEKTNEMLAESFKNANELKRELGLIKKALFEKED